MKKLSILVPCYNEDKVLPLLRKELTAFLSTLAGRALDYEVILVDDGSKDLTWFLINEWAEADSRVRGISLSRNFGHQAALTCAYENCTGDAAVSVDADLQDPPEVIAGMIDKWEQGANIVFAVRRQRTSETFFKRWTAAAYYRLLHLLGLSFVEKDCGDFRLMDRRSINALNSMREKNRLLRAMVGWAGFRTDRVYFDRPARRGGDTKYPLRKMILLALDGVISFTHIPLRGAYIFALMIMLCVLLYLGTTVVRYLLGYTTLVPGWTSLLLAITAFGTANLLCLGVIGEYVGRIYSEVKDRPLYLVRTDTVTKTSPQPGLRQ
ncbi:MAG: glycosyltransferase family 2 protein [bacterium]